MPKANPTSAAGLDRIVETIIYLTTESRRLSRERCAEYGITATQLTVLKLLHAIGGLSLSKLSSEIRAHNSTVTGIVDRMERDGLVERVQSAEDRRVWNIDLTPRGRELAKKIDVAPWETLRGALDALDDKERKQLVTILSKLAGHVAAQIETKREATP